MVSWIIHLDKFSTMKLKYFALYVVAALCIRAIQRLKIPTLTLSTMCLEAAGEMGRVGLVLVASYSMLNAVMQQ